MIDKTDPAVPSKSVPGLKPNTRSRFQLADQLVHCHLPVLAARVEHLYRGPLHGLVFKSGEHSPEPGNRFGVEPRGVCEKTATPIRGSF